MRPAGGEPTLVGRVLRDKWKIDAVLGKGGMATVYAATHRNGMRGAIKLLHPRFDDSPEARRRFVREGRAANRVDHPGVVRVLDDDTTDDGLVFLVMDLLQGVTWKTAWERAGRRLPIVEAVDVAIEILDVLAAAHRAGVVHRDVKPDNVFLVDGGGIRLLDFGIARLREAHAEVTQDGATLGTPAFMSPEQALAHWDDVDARSDVYAVAASLWVQLTGTLVHAARTAPELIVATATKSAPPFASVFPEAPVELATILDKALAFRREDRWQSAESMRDALSAIRPRLAARSTKTIPMAAVPREAVAFGSGSGSGPERDAPADLGAGHTVRIGATPGPSSTSPEVQGEDATATHVEAGRVAPTLVDAPPPPTGPRAAARRGARVVAFGAAGALCLGMAALAASRVPTERDRDDGELGAPTSPTASTTPPVEAPTCGELGGPCCISGAACTGGDACGEGVCTGTVKELFAGMRHTCASMRDGSVRCWGEGSHLLGTGTQRAVRKPTGLVGITAPSALVFGESSALAIVGDRVVGWGSNETGLLGAGAPRRGIVDSAHPADLHLDGAADIDIGSIGTDPAACAIVRDEVRCWGRAGGGIRGRNDGPAPKVVPLADKVKAVIPIPMTPRRVGLGASDFACAVFKADMEQGLACWGTRKPAMTLSQETAPGDSGFSFNVSWAASAVPVTPFSVGPSGACTASGNLLSCWGRAGACGAKPGVPGASLDSRLTLPAPISDVAVGGSHVCAIAESKVYCWGQAGTAAIGRDAPGEESCTPRHVPLPFPARQVVVGSAHTCVLTTNGAVHCFGNDDVGQLGCATERRTAPCRVRFEP